MAEQTVPKWEGKATVELRDSTAEQIWPFLEEFCNLDKLFPSVDSCYRVEGTPGKPGLVRHCEGKLGWAKEKLLTIDPTNRLLSYEIVENSVGFNKYVATFKVLPIVLPLQEEEDGGGSKPVGGCRIEWSFIADPVEGMGSLKDFVSYTDYTLQFMAKKMEDAIKDQI